MATCAVEGGCWVGVGAGVRLFSGGALGVVTDGTRGDRGLRQRKHHIKV